MLAVIFMNKIILKIFVWRRALAFGFAGHAMLTQLTTLKEYAFLSGFPMTTTIQPSPSHKKA